MTPLPPKVSLIGMRDIVIFPGGIVAFKVGRENSKHALLSALESNQLALFPLKDADTELSKLEDIHPLGVLCEIFSHTERPDNQFNVTVRGFTRIRVSKVIKSSPFFIIKPIEVMNTNAEAKVKLPPKKDIEEAVKLIISYNPESALKTSGPIPYDAEPGALADVLVQRSATAFENQLACLYELDSRKRLKLAYEILVKEGLQAQLESEINEQVTAAIKDEHRQIFLRGQLKVILDELGENSPLSLYNPIFTGKSFKVNPRLLFVLMPFAEEFRPIYDEIIKPVVEQFGLMCVRADDLYGSKAIIEDIWKLINEAKVIIADVTRKNANVFYEIGLAHAVGKEVIIISQSIEDVPFDLRHLRCFIYKDSVAGFRKLETQLKQALHAIGELKEHEPQN